MTSCANKDDVHRRFLEGVELFNRKEFFECHEILEEVWNAQEEPEKQLTQGLIQVAVGFYHALRGNKVGAIKLFTRGLPRIRPFATPDSADPTVAAIASSNSQELTLFIGIVERNLQLLENSAPETDVSSLKFDIPTLQLR